MSRHSSTPLLGFMALFRALILRPLLREKTRSGLTILGIAVGVSVLVAIQLSNDSALRAFGESVDAISGRANYVVLSDSGTVEERDLIKLQELWSLGARFAPVLDQEGMIEPSQIPIRLLAVDLLSDLHFRDYRYARIATSSSSSREQTTAPSIAAFLELFRHDSVVLPAAFAAENGLSVGSPVSLTFAGRTRRLVVRGLLQAEGPATAFNGSLAVMDIGAAQDAFGLSGQLSRIDLLIPDEVSDRAIAIVQRALPNARVERPARRNERVGKMLRAFRINLFALSGVALLVGVFLVYNTVLISILRRRGEVGILKTLGTGSGQILLAFLAEGTLFGLVGSVLGIALGYLLAYGTLDLIGRTINALYVSSAPSEIVLRPLLVIVAMLIGTLVSIASSIQPAIEAARIRPSALIRTGLYQRIPRRKTIAFALAGAGLFVLGALITFIPPVDGIPVGGYVAVIFVVAGFACITPLATLLISAVLRPPLEKMFGMTGKLAALSLPASLRRVAVAAAALSIATGMMIAVSLMIGSFRETVNVWVQQTVQSDLWIRPARGLASNPSAVFPASISDDLRGLPFVLSFDRIRVRETIYRDSLIQVGGGDFDVAVSFAAMPMVEPRSQKAAIAEAIKSGGVLISESMSIKFGLHRGDTIELPARGSPARFIIRGVYRDYSNDRGVVIMNRPDYIRAYGDDSINTIAIFLREGVDPARARFAIERALGKKYRVFAFTNASIRTEVMKIFDQTFLITYALLGVSIVVAVLGIINTLSALILERRREIALLKVLGMSQGQVRLMIILESAILGIVSTILGLASGYLLSWILIFVINKQSFGWTIEFDPPKALVAISLAITFLATVTAGLYPAVLANRIRTSTALKSE